jgi:hypothetical protein
MAATWFTCRGAFGRQRRPVDPVFVSIRDRVENLRQARGHRPVPGPEIRREPVENTDSLSDEESVMTKPTSATGADPGPSLAGASAGAPAGPADGGAASVGADPGRSAAAERGERQGTVAGSTDGASDAQYPDSHLGQPEPDGSTMAGDELPDARSLWILAFTFAAVGLFFPLAGLIAIGCGALAWRKGSGRGRIATFVAIATTLVGIVLAIIVLAT